MRLFRLLDDGRQVAVRNDELLRAAYLGWPRRTARRFVHEAKVAFAFMQWCLCSCAYRVLYWSANLLLAASSKSHAGMRRAWHQVRPWDFWGEEANFKRQRKYDAMSASFASMTTEERNRMVPAMTASAEKPRGLNEGPGYIEVDHAR